MFRGFSRAMLVGGLLVAAGAETVRGASEAGAQRGPRQETRSDESRAFAQALLTETNRVRRDHGRKALRANAELTAAADDQASFMALRMQVQHGSFLAGQATAAERVRRHGLDALAVAENVAATPLGAEPGAYSAAHVAAQLVEQWLNSPGHRANLLDRRLTHFGGAVRIVRLGNQWTAYGTQVFMIARPPHGRVTRGGT